MSMSLTATVPRGAVIDLTTDPSPPTSPSLAAPPPQQHHATSFGEPPKKKRRLGDCKTQKRSVKACLQEQVFPHVGRAVSSLSDKLYRVDDIAVQAATTLARRPSFLARLQEQDRLLPRDELDADARARELVQRLAALPRYQIPPAETLPNTSPQDAPSEPNDLHDLAESSPTNLAKAVLPSIDSPQPMSTVTPLQATYFQRRRPTKPRTRIEGAPTPTNKWFHIQRRPYLTAGERDLLAQGARHRLAVLPGVAQQPTIYHVDFTSDEISQIIGYLSKYLPKPVSPTIASLAQLCTAYNVPSIVGEQMRGRGIEDLRNFCSDLLAGRSFPPTDARVLSLEREVDDRRVKEKRTSRVSSLLLARELVGNAGFGRMRRYENFENEFRKVQEDGLTLIAEFTNCAGDISTMSWVPNDNVICGTTAHSDTHNQQYNKPGNLVLCSASLGTLRAFSDHRIPRPVVEKGENSTEAMRQSQDPWLYSSVVSSDYDKIHKRAYTSSFDKTVKIWKVDETGRSMSCMATWQLQGNVNFVAAAKDASGRVATAADVPTEALRVYTVNEEKMAESPYQAFSCSRNDADGSEKWAYFPATMQWGPSSRTSHLLVLGYSPRSLTNDDRDIPEDKRNSGEIALWDANLGRRVPVLTATSANVFEVTWHPDHLRFIVATSPCGLNVKHGVRTQIHLFQRDRDRQDGAYSEYQNLDCSASDINELTFMPNSVLHAYVTAGCTDGKVYVWDTSQGDRPIHVLKHGQPVDDYNEDREKEDTGIKFTAWGITPDRFYTGSSDGVVKVWNVRNRRRPLVRNLLEAPGPISCGAFSSDCSKLVIGDATGRVFLLSVDIRDAPETHFKTLPITNRRVRRPKPCIPHPEPAPPGHDPDAMQDDNSEVPIGTFARQTYLDTKQLVINPNPVIGAVQGPEYASTGLFRREAHLDEETSGPLMTEYERLQRESLDSSRGRRRRSVRRIKDVAGPPEERLDTLHEMNRARDLDVNGLGVEAVEELVRAGAQLSIEEDWGLEYEDGFIGEGLMRKGGEYHEGRDKDG